MCVYVVILVPRLLRSRGTHYRVKQFSGLWTSTVPKGEEDWVDGRCKSTGGTRKLRWKPTHQSGKTKNGGDVSLERIRNRASGRQPRVTDDRIEEDYLY